MAYVDGVIGDVQATAKQPIALANTVLPIVTQAEIADVTDPINDAAISEKKLGALCLVNNAGVIEAVYATGPLAADPWNRLVDPAAAAAAYVTPA